MRNKIYQIFYIIQVNFLNFNKNKHLIFLLLFFLFRKKKSIFIKIKKL